MTGLSEIEFAIRQLPPGDVDAVRVWLDTLDRVTFRVDQARWDAFCAKLDEPPAANPGVQRLLATQPVWAR